ncbi:hypothetical protein RJ639_013840 [Escallonia herrerae]|uniref:SBP-type domain-containing protein n=1 Tax=Escallonia herrerae TaxID=1293975 RepID=A0AA88VLG1_9ASTE|nr:hypothetical protein RJ639_013840 [Escallonia herrerae]
MELEPTIFGTVDLKFISLYDGALELFSDGKDSVSDESASPADAIPIGKNGLVGWQLRSPFSLGSSMISTGQENIENHEFLSDESASPPDNIPIGKSGLVGWELRTPSSLGSSMISSSQEKIENQEFVEMDFPEMIQKCLSNGSIRVEFVESKYWDLGTIDLKLGRIADQRDPRNLISSKISPNLYSAESCKQAKRGQMGNLSPSIAMCQVHGCKKDLSSFKEYHKRHKVCEVHSKTEKVIVKGVERRFHWLAEFDDGKRSCRKRLAGHNERRRKSHTIGVSHGLMVVASSVDVTASRWPVLDEVFFVRDRTVSQSVTVVKPSRSRSRSE